MANKNAAVHCLIYFFAALYTGHVSAVDYSDSFGTDTAAHYTVTDTWVDGGIGQFFYDEPRQSLVVLTGDNIGLQFSHNVTPTESGYFEIDFLPVRTHPLGGTVAIRLVQDRNNYYQIKNTDGYGPSKVKKVVNGQKTDRLFLDSEYSQDNSYRINVTFGPVVTTVEAFGSSLTMESDSDGIIVRRFEIEVRQQDAYFDNIVFHAANSDAILSVGLQWDANVESDVSGYKIYYKTGSPGDAYDGQGIFQGDSPIVVPVEDLYDRDSPDYVLDGLSEDTAYHIVVTAYDDQHNESGYSNEVVFPQ